LVESEDGNRGGRLAWIVPNGKSIQTWQDRRAPRGGIGSNPVTRFLKKLAGEDQSLL
jgi:hypothetical protein